MGESGTSSTNKKPHSSRRRVTSEAKEERAQPPASVQKLLSALQQAQNKTVSSNESSSSSAGNEAKTNKTKQARNQAVAKPQSAQQKQRQKGGVGARMQQQHETEVRAEQQASQAAAKIGQFGVHQQQQLQPKRQRQTSTTKAPKSAAAQPQIPNPNKSHGSPRIPKDVLDSLEFRFISNMHYVDKRNRIRVCFQVELAHWYYVDFYVENGERKDCHGIGIRDFSRQLFLHCKDLHISANNVDEIIAEWREYKSTVPTYGAILLDESLENILLVQSYFAKGNNWGFPKGKINQNEPPRECAIRETYEETGFDFSTVSEKEVRVQKFLNDAMVRLYIVPNVPNKFPFAPQTRKEIKKIQWFSIWDLPVEKGCELAPHLEGHKFFMVIPFVTDIQNYVEKKLLERKKTQGSSSTSKSPPKKPKPQSVLLPEKESDAPTPTASIFEQLFPKYQNADQTRQDPWSDQGVSVTPQSLFSPFSARNEDQNTPTSVSQFFQNVSAAQNSPSPLKNPLKKQTMDEQVATSSRFSATGDASPILKRLTSYELISAHKDAQKKVISGKERIEGVTEEEPNSEEVRRPTLPDISPSVGGMDVLATLGLPTPLKAGVNPFPPQSLTASVALQPVIKEEPHSKVLEDVASAAGIWSLFSSPQTRQNQSTIGAQTQLEKALGQPKWRRAIFPDGSASSTNPNPPHISPLKLKMPLPNSGVLGGVFLDEETGFAMPTAYQQPVVTSTIPRQLHQELISSSTNSSDIEPAQDTSSHQGWLDSQLVNSIMHSATIPSDGGATPTMSTSGGIPPPMAASSPRSTSPTPPGSSRSLSHLISKPIQPHPIVAVPATASALGSAEAPKRGSRISLSDNSAFTAIPLKPSPSSTTSQPRSTAPPPQYHTPLTPLTTAARRHHQMQRSAEYGRPADNRSVTLTPSQHLQQHPVQQYHFELSSTPLNVLFGGDVTSSVYSSPGSARQHQGQTAYQHQLMQSIVSPISSGRSGHGTNTSSLAASLQELSLINREANAVYSPMASTDHQGSSNTYPIGGLDSNSWYVPECEQWKKPIKLDVDYILGPREAWDVTYPVQT